MVINETRMCIDCIRTIAVYALFCIFALQSYHADCLIFIDIYTITFLSLLLFRYYHCFLFLLDDQVRGDFLIIRAQNAAFALQSIVMSIVLRFDSLEENCLNRPT